MSTSKDYVEIAKKVYRAIGLKKHLVAVKFFDNEKTIPEGFPRPKSPMYYCEAVGHAMQGETLLMLREDHGCDRGAYMLGVKEPSTTIANGELYARAHMVESARAGKRLIDQAPKIPVGNTAAILLTPLEKTKFDPDVVLAAVTPHQALVILNASNYQTGIEIQLPFQILCSFCAYATALPYRKGQVNATIPQEQSRKRSNLSNEEMIVGIPGEMIERIAEVIERLCCVVPSNLELDIK